MMKLMKHTLDRKTLETMYLYFARPILEYANMVWIGCDKIHSDLLETIQIDAAKIVTGAIKGTKHESLYKEVGWDTLETRRRNRQIVLFHKIVHNETPDYLTQHIPQSVLQSGVSYNLRNQNNLRANRCLTVRFQKSFFNSVVPLWNNVNEDIRNSESCNVFANHIKIKN